MYEQYIWKRVRLIPLEYSRMYDFKGHTIDFNDAMVRATKADPYIEILWEMSLSDGVVLMKAEFSDWQVWYIIPDWIIDEGVALFV